MKALMNYKNTERPKIDGLINGVVIEINQEINKLNLMRKLYQFDLLLKEIVIDDHNRIEGMATDHKL